MHGLSRSTCNQRLYTSVFQRVSHRAGYRHKRAAMPTAAAAAATQQPVLLLDIMDTVVTDPFFEHMPRFFEMTFKELLAAKHPTGWHPAHRTACMGSIPTSP